MDCPVICCSLLVTAIMHRRWIVNRTNADYLAYLSKASSISPVFAQILINRGIKTVSDVQDFLNPGLTGCSDPFALGGMRAAIDRLKAAHTQGDKVLVHGDYDADGLTATALLVSALRTAGFDTDYFIPHRMTHGYGFNAAGVAAAQKAGSRLIITVDCGISSFAAAAHAKSLGIDVIITDHHEPARREDERSGMQHPDEGRGYDASPLSHVGDVLLPDAVAVINPKLSIQDAKLSILSGAGIAFKVAQAMALDADLRFSHDDLLSLLDLAALGTIADIVPLVGENRVITKEAMQYIQSGTRRGLQALKQAAGIGGRQIRAGMLSFTIVPRINAAGRIAEAQDVVNLLLSDSDQEAYELSAWLDSVNSERQRIEEAVFQDALERVKGSDADTVIVLAAETWHEGVLGIVASKLADAFGVPAFVFSITDGIAKGSARSIPAFDICAGLGACRDLLISFGGHKQAAGVRLKAEDLQVFQQRMRDVISLQISAQDMIPALEIHAPVKLSEVNAGLMKELELLDPVGHGNPEPLLGAKDLEVIGPKIVGSRHLKMKLRKGAIIFDAIGFDMGRLFETVGQAATLDSAFTPAYNDWNGNRYLQLVLKGIRPSA